MLQEALPSAHGMAEGLGRVVLTRDRFARSWGLGDRKTPTAHTPALVLLDGDIDVDANIAPFKSSRSGDIPAILTLQSRLPFSPPDFAEISPSYEVSIGNVLPPSLDEADAGEMAGTSNLLPVSWQRLNHDESLLNPELLPDIVVLVDALQLTSQPGKLVEAISVLKRRFPGALLWTPGIGGPDNLAVLTWFGVDLFDMARSRQASTAGVLLSIGGPRHIVDSMNESSDMKSQLTQWTQAIAETRSALQQGTLRALADKQSLNSPKLVEHLRRHDSLVAEMKGILASHVNRNRVFNCFSHSTQSDPLITEWENYICNDYRSPKDLDEVLILLPCSAKKPYRLSKSHGRFIRAIGTSACHEVIVTSPLGLVPRDLEEVWPAAHYDVPVTGDWSRDEILRIEKMITALLANHSYKRIINHSGMDLSFVEIEVIDTRQGQSAGAYEVLQRLGEAVKSAVSDFSLARRRGEQINIDNFSSVARKHMNNDHWLEGVKVRGKPPRWKIEDKGTQLAQWSIDRGGFALSKPVVKRLAKHKSLPEVHIKSDISWKGDIFHQIVESFDSSIKAGQDLLVMQNGEVIGLARAFAPAWEWSGTPGRLAKSHQRL
jgi:archaeosine synthase